MLSGHLALPREGGIRAHHLMGIQRKMIHMIGGERRGSALHRHRHHPLLLLHLQDVPFHKKGRLDEEVDVAMRHGRRPKSYESSRRGGRTSPSSPTMELSELRTKCWPSSNNLTQLSEMKISLKLQSSETCPCTLQSPQGIGGQAYELKVKPQRHGSY